MMNYTNIQSSEKLSGNPASLSKGIYVKLFLALAMVCALIFFSFKWNSTQTINKINISGNYIVSPSEILNLIPSKALNSPKGEVPLQSIEEEVNKHPYVKASKAMYGSSRQLNIEIIERVPEAILVEPDGNFNYVDKFGFLLPYRFSGNYSDLPIIRNVANNEGYYKKILKNTINIIEELKKIADSSLYYQISEIKYLKESGSFDLITSDYGLEIHIGKAQDLSEKFQFLSDFMQKVTPKINIKEINNIDIRWAGQIVVKQLSDNL